jgi:hypothetical protein
MPLSAKPSGLKAISESLFIFGYQGKLKALCTVLHSLVALSLSSGLVQGRHTVSIAPVSIPRLVTLGVV